MFLNFYRNIFREKALTTINLVNLVIGFTTFTILCVVVLSELSFDKFNAKYERIYRVQTKQIDSSPVNYCAYSPAAIRYHLMNNLPEVEQVLIMREASGQYFTLPNGTRLYDKYGYWCENSIFDIFTVGLKEGNKATALSNPNTIALSETLAKKLVPQGNAVGSQVLIGEKYPLTVTAVYTNFPENSSLKPSFLVSMATFESLEARIGFRDNWTYIDNLNYVLLKGGTDPKLVDEKIKNAFSEVKNYKKSTPYLLPLSKHHISPNNQSDMIIGLSILSFAAILVLILSCVNYVNLSIANSAKRIKEIAVKKVIGSSKRGIALQFISETVTLTLIATIISLFLTWELIPVINSILQNTIEYEMYINAQLVIFIFSVGILTGILSGLYPGLILASYNPVKALKGKILTGNSGEVSLKKVLVATQFTISLFMLIVSIMLFKQVNFYLNKDLGFESKRIFFSEINFKENLPFENIKSRMLQHPEIEDISISSTIPFLGNIGGFVSWEGGQEDEKVMISRNYVNDGFIPVYHLNMVYGRNFSKEYPSDKKCCIINETAVKMFGWDDPVGKQIKLYENSYPVIGVVKDFHPFSLQQAIPTYVMLLNNDTLSGHQILTFRFAPGKEQRARQLAAQELADITPNTPFAFHSFSEVFFLDGAIGFWQALKKIFLFFAIVTLVISSVGLFGLVLYTTKRRIKEIGIRKVLGSSMGMIYRQLTFEILGMLVFAVLIASPAAFYTYDALPGAYKETLSALDFLYSIGILLIIAIITISYHVLKVALSNPVEALRYE